MDKKQLQGIAMGVAGVLLFSSKAVMVKLAYQYEVDVVSLLMLRMGFALPIYVFMLVYALTRKEGKVLYARLSFGDWLMLMALGTVGYYLASWLDFKGLQLIDASLERLILFAYPTFVLLFSRLFFKKPITLAQVLAILGCYVGVVVMFAGNLLGNEVATNGWGVLFVLGSGLTYALYLVGSQSMMKKIPPKEFTNFAMIISCVCVLVHFNLSSELSIFQLPWQVYLIGLLMAVFATVIPSYLISIAISILGASRLAIIGCLGPVSTISLAMLLLGETLGVAQWVGAAIIVSTVVWINLNKSAA